MRQTVPLRQEPERESEQAAGRPSRSIDEWLADAVAEQASRAAAKAASFRRDEPAPRDESARDERPAAAAEPVSPQPAPAEDTVASIDEYEKLVAATTASERRAIETATKTAVALGSVASWIEKAQEKLNETERAATEAQSRTAAAVTDAIGAIGDRLEKIERKVEVGASPSPAATAPPPGATSAFDEVLRGFEARVQEMADRLVAPRAIGRRGIPAEAEIVAAVDEIRSHQVRIESGESPRAAPPPAASRAQTEMLAMLRADIDRLAGKIGEPRGEVAGVDGLRQEIDNIHSSMASLATREQLGSVERSIAALSSEVAEAGTRGGSLGGVAGEVEALQARIHGLADGEGGEQLGRITRDIDVLSHKLDMVAASGIDPASIETLTNEVGEVRAALAGLATPRDVAGIGEQLIELKIEIARLGSRQVDSRDFTSLRVAFDDLKDMMSRGGHGLTLGEFEVGAAQSQPVTKEELQPIAEMMVRLVDKLDRMEKLAADPEQIEHLERQISALNATIADNAGNDPALATLSRAMTALMSEVSGWREGTAEIAEQAARNAVAERLGAFAPPAHAPREREEAAPAPPAPRPEQEAPDRRDESLRSVHARLEDVVRRIGGLDATMPPPPSIPDPMSRELDLRLEREASRDEAAPRPIDEEPRHPTRPEPEPALEWSARDEILLEPGAERPPATGPAATTPAPEASAGDPTDVKANFIAAARRAAQAAAADASRPKASRTAPASQAADADGSRTAGLRASFTRFRRPLLVAAAAIAVAIGGYGLLRDVLDERSPPGATASIPTVAPAPSPPRTIAAPAAPSASEAPEPQTTQSFPERPAALPGAGAATTTPTAPVPSKIDARDPNAPDEAQRSAALAIQGSAPTPPASLPGKPASISPDGSAAIAALKLSAQAGEPVALYELAARTADGRGVARDPRAAVALFEKAAEKNMAPAQYRTGNLYEKGIGIPRDVEAARKWYQRAAENGNTRSMHNLAVLTAEGAGGKPDYAAAIGWFQRAAEHGVRDSQFNLAVLYARGLGTPQDLVKSHTWFSIAATQGDEEAGRKRDEVGQRLSQADLQRAKTAAERWRATPPSAAANEVQLPAAGWPGDGAAKRASRDNRG